MKRFKFRQWLQSGLPYIWLNAGAVSVCLVMVVGLILLVAVRGLVYFWPQSVVQFQYTEADGEARYLVGEIISEEHAPALREDAPHTDSDGMLKKHLIKTGNRDLLGSDFRWVAAGAMHVPRDVMVVERREWGNFYGFLHVLKRDGVRLFSEPDQWAALDAAIDRSNRLSEEVHHIEKYLIGAINHKMERLRLAQRGLELKGITQGAQLVDIERQRDGLRIKYEGYVAQLTKLYAELNQEQLVAKLVDGTEVEIPLAKIVRVYRPNQMDHFDKLRFYFVKLAEFLLDEPREANTEGGVFPAIFGTVLMVIIMSIMVTPFGVVAAIYLREYATQGPFTRVIRIAVNNLAGVPSIVYGVFGLGFFVYFLGGNIDKLFFPEAFPTPVFGTPGLLWASLTLAILTVPVVIVATEEGLSRVPREIREGSMALGATKIETLWRTVLPMTTPAMLTGLILAVARAAGEVAPLMLVGVVKLAPSLAFDSQPPFLHLDRKFMHLGFHIYDIGFQSPNVEATRPLVYATTLLLVLIIIVLNLAAIRIRNNLRGKYSAAQ